MIKVLAIDDEPLALQQLASYIGKMPYLELVKTCRSAADALRVMEEEVIDAIFVDINMPDLNGMEFVKSLRVPPLVVFTTAYSEYAVEGFRVDAVDYLLKPFGLQDFQHAAERVKERYEAKHRTWTEDRPASGDEPVGPAAAELSAGETDEDALFLKTDYKTVRISMSDIRYVEAMSEYLKIYLEGQTKPLVVLLSMKKLEERLPSQVFMRIHRSYIINLTKIREVNKNRVIMDADTYLPVGDNYKDAFQSYLGSKFLGK